MTEISPRVQLAGSRLGPGDNHVCAFFHNREEEYRTLLPFMQEGLKANDKAVQIIDERHRGDQVRRLARGGVDCEACESSGQLEVRTWEQAHLTGGRFDQEAMMALLAVIATQGVRDGFGLTRLWANMEWAVEDFPGVQDILEYESRVNDLLPHYDMVAVCTYDLNRFSAAVVMDILRTHPMVILGGILQKNPFYVPPAQFLEEFRGRPRSAP